ncbi:MAG: hypothetical protein F4Y27_08650 [Acidimicrobiaceae bacterium]|nr:hypothetical protein [Acidimicrobiaceae bacterium]MXW74919.1 hypothetical protein [Acidimicrobiaceae bacterium]MYA74731.1 hypothetical protein [Acidimicrobiaceae bacterium]MYC42868.1 hypothetical protein [Acidimicrobiaceae bacterium]MYD06712.1 hypothetical protein [Acidimicrobiaceae bacterium]
MTSKAITASSLPRNEPAKAPTKTGPNKDDDTPQAAALRRKFLRKAVEEYEAEFGAFTEEELAQARSETAR